MSEDCDIKMSRKKQEKVKNAVNEDAASNNNIEEFSDVEERTDDEIMVTEEVTDKIFGIVTLVTNKYVVYDLNGNSVYKRGKFNYSIGDKIEV